MWHPRVDQPSQSRHLQQILIWRSRSPNRKRLHGKNHIEEAIAGMACVLDNILSVAKLWLFYEVYVNRIGVY
jgi:hypothetical protein